MARASLQLGIHLVAHKVAEKVDAENDAERITLVIKINCVPKGEGKWEIGVSECKS